jgi:FkbH-like protein
VRDFGVALESFAAKATAPTLVCVCPSGPAANTDRFHAAEQSLLRHANALPNVHTMSSAQLQASYPVAEWHDPHAHRAGRVPYTQAGFAAISTALFRTACALNRPPYKVIVLDCDNTLWKGVCGEDGVGGVDVEGPYARLQAFMIEQMNAGMLLCICSKNNKADVDEVFACGNAMPLRREHIAAWRVNWNSKADNIHSLARELNVGLDSIVVIDDSAAECAEISARCPGVLCLQLPREPERIDAFLANAWVFDQTAATEEDRARTRMYQDNARREQFRAQAMSLADFIGGLELRVTVEDAGDADVDRISQLTYRTNQFNLTTVRRSAAAIREVLQGAGAGCLCVRVTDRFGDYGLVGAVLYQRETDRLVVDTFLLSCRVLGRGVEHQVLAAIGQRAVAEGVRFVDLPYRPTEKNAPARIFLEAVTGCTVDAPAVHTFEAQRIARVTYDPRSQSHEEERPAPEPGSRRSMFAAGRMQERLRMIAERPLTPEQIVQEIDRSRVSQPADTAAIPLESSDPIEAALLRIWGSVLGRSRLALHDNFFDLGGTSLKAVQVIAAIKKELGRDVSIVSLFESPSVASLAARLRAGDGGADDSADIMARGQRRKRVSRTRAV